MLCPECQSLLQEDTTSCPVCGEAIRPEGEGPVLWHRDHRAHLLIAIVFLAIVGILYAVIAIDPGATPATIASEPALSEATETTPPPSEELVGGKDVPAAETLELEVLSDQDLIVERIHLFNDAWLSFVHTGSRAIEEHITEDSDVYRVLRDFDREGLKERFLVLDVLEVTVDGETAVARVHEVIEKTRAGETWSDTYNWRYRLRWEENQWMIERYETDDL